MKCSISEESLCKPSKLYTNFLKKYLWSKSFSIQRHGVYKVWLEESTINNSPNQHYHNFV